MLEALIVVVVLPVGLLASYVSLVMILASGRMD